MLNLCCPTSLHSEDERGSESERWRRLWTKAVVQGVVMEDLTHADRPQAVGILIAAWILPELHDRLVAPGGPYVLEGLVEAVQDEDFPTPTEEEIGVANAGDGIDAVFCWLGYAEEGLALEEAAGLRSRVVSAYNELYQGNRIRRITIESLDRKVLSRFDAYGYAVLRKERGTTVMSLHRDQAMVGSDLSSQRLFSYDPPVLGFTPAQRAILLLARQGYTDQEISVSLGKSADSIKKRWAGIYARFAQVFPGRLPSANEGSRGTEKRRTLLTYLRDRPEELRPYQKS